jgi:class 3 adenylate cyclase
MPPRASTSGRRLATVLFTDIVASTERAVSIGDRRWRELLATYRTMVRRALRSTRGREIDDAGDGFFAVFEHPADAIACACMLADEVRTHGLEVRSGIHMGEVETTGAKLGGIAVHIGARVCSQAGAGQVLVSSTVRDVVRGSEYGFIDLGARPLKGVPGEIQLFSVTWDEGRHVHDGGTSRRRYLVAAAAILAIAIVAALVLLLTRGPSTVQPVAASIVTVAGTGGTGDGPDHQPATTTTIDHPVAVALDSDGRVYLVDGNRVRRINDDGTVSTIAGTGQAGALGDGGPATAAELDGPQSVAIDSSGDVFIADSQNNRVQEVTASGTMTTFAGTGQSGYSGDGGPASKATLNDPTGVAIGFGGAIFIADSGNNVIREATRDPVSGAYVISTFAGTGDAGYNGEGGQANSALLDDPQCVAVDAENNVYVADTLNYRVEKITVAGIISTVAGSGDPSYSGDKGPATSASLDFATGRISGGGCLAVDSKGDLFIADGLSNRVREVAVDGIITTVAGNGRAGFGGDKGPATDAELDLPLGVAVDSAGRLFIADSDGNRIRRVG